MGGVGAYFHQVGDAVAASSFGIFLKKFAYEVETVELIFNEEEFVREFALNRFELVRAAEYQAYPATDAYQITYLFRRV